MDEIQAKLFGIFFPFAAKKMAAAKESSNFRFAYYTSAETALQIFRKREVWMRNARTMNDFNEITYGKALLLETYRSDVGKAFQQAISSMYPHFWAAFETLFNRWLPTMLNQTYLTCFSEHLATEDDLGRLSMWRAYGRKNGVALVANKDVFVSETDALGIYSSPVAYIDAAGFAAELSAITDTVLANRELLLGLGEERIRDHVFAMFQAAVLCTKHPGFCEELEWRAYWSPTFQGDGKFKHDVECIGGVPQIVLKVPLVDSPEEKLVGLSPNGLVNRVIVGPSEFAHSIYDALILAMGDAGVIDPEQRIVLSNIPLRHS